MKRFFKCVGMMIMFSLVFGSLQGCTEKRKTNENALYFKGKAEKIYQGIKSNFYDQKSNLYFETTLGKSGKDEKKFSYIWPLAALFQAYSEKSSLLGGTDANDAVKSLEQYYSAEDSVDVAGLGYESFVVSLGGGQRYYDDNQWIGLTYCDLYEATKNPLYLKNAQEIFQFGMTGFDTAAGGGIYWREYDQSSKNTCSNGPQIVLALRLMALDGANDAKFKYMENAKKLYDWVNKNFKSPENVYWDKINLSDGKIDKTTWTYNTGIMIQANALFYALTKDERYLKEAQLIAAASLKHFAPSGQFPDTLWFNSVLLRGYVALNKIDGDPQFLNALETDAKRVLETQTNPTDGLIGTKEPKTLIDQAAMLEICASLGQRK